MNDIYKYILTFVGGGLAGSILTNILNWYKGRMQVMECRYTDDEVLSKLPIKQDDGILHDNIYCKYFELRNTTNIDIIEFKMIFQFDRTATITEYIDKTKSGTGKHKMKRTQPNECTITIRNFNRKDKIEFIFKIANITDDQYYITEDECKGFKIKTKDCRKKKLNTKAKLASNILSIQDGLNKAENN